MGDSARELDYDGIMNLAKEKAEKDAYAMFPDSAAEARRRKIDELTLRYFRQMYYPQR